MNDYQRKLDLLKRTEQIIPDLESDENALDFAGYKVEARIVDKIVDALKATVKRLDEEVRAMEVEMAKERAAEEKEDWRRYV